MEDRMEVTCYHVTARVRHGLMRKNERRMNERSRVPSNYVLPAGSALVPIMIACDHIHCQTGMRCTPLGEGREKTISQVRCRMHEITEHEQPLACVSFDQRGDTGQIRKRRSARHGNARTPENVDLAEMGIGDQ
jgi:hypothetical protein